jgi:membrane-anchored glycerophosphoryl diester phosphodiesterase (GDPDase)
MEENQSTPLISLGIDTISRDHLTEAARWARFLAIVGFVICGLVVIIGIFANTLFSSMLNQMGEGELNGMDMSGIGSILAVLYIGIALLYFFPCLFLFRFANYMKAALITGEQETINKSFQNLKKMFRFVGILTIFVICLYALGMLMAIAGAAISK